MKVRQASLLLSVCLCLTPVVVAADDGGTVVQRLERVLGVLHQLLGAEPAPQRLLTEHPVRDLADRAAATHGIDPDFFFALVVCESGLDPNAVSHAGAIGLCQLMPETAREMGINPHDIGENLDGGARYLRAMLLEFRDPQRALWAYNAGPGRVRQGETIPRESRIYARRVIRLYRQLRS